VFQNSLGRNISKKIDYQKLKIKNRESFLSFIRLSNAVKKNQA